MHIIPYKYIFIDNPLWIVNIILIHFSTLQFFIKCVTQYFDSQNQVNP